MIEIADEVYGMQDRYGSYETIFMTGEFELEVGMQALERAAERFMGTGEDGVEYEDIEYPWKQGIYTPNGYLPPEVTEFGIILIVDCKGVIDPLMQATFRRILEEEVRAAGIHEATIVPAKLSYDRSRMVPFDRDETEEAAALAAWKAAAFATSIELGPDGATLDFRIGQRADWDGSDRLRDLLYELVQNHTLLAQKPSRWPSHLQHATDLPWRVVLECRSPPDATIERVIDYETSRPLAVCAPAGRRPGTFVVIRPHDAQHS